MPSKIELDKKIARAQKEYTVVASKLKIIDKKINKLFLKRHKKLQESFLK